MMTRKINRHFISWTLTPYGGLADVDGEYEKYVGLDLNDEATVKTRIIRPEIVPYVHRFEADSLARVKSALTYGLSDPDTRFDRIFYSILMPFDAPDDPRDFFVWIWEECFPGEDYRIDITQYELKDDFEEPTWTIKLKPE